MSEATIELRFYEELNDFLPRERRKRSYRRPIFLSPAVKDVIEAEGIPHTEVDLIIVNGESVGWGHRLQAGDRVAVYPVFEGLDIQPLQHLRPAPLRETRFVLDVHLGTLARRLRLLGFDTLYRNDYSDAAIVAISAAENRIVLTRDVGLLKNGRLSHGYWVRASRWQQQLAEVMARLDLYRAVRPFTRCTVCNGEVLPVDRALVERRVPPKTAAAFERFFRCRSCGRIYWEGSHYEQMRRWLEALTASTGESRPPRPDRRTATPRDPDGHDATR